MPPDSVKAATPEELEITRIYRATGVFLWFDCLKDLGVRSPARGVFLIGHTLLRLPTVGSVPPDDHSSLREWIRGLLKRVTDVHGDSAIEPYSVLALRVARYIPWDPYEELAQLMAVECGSRALANLRRRNQVSHLGDDGLRDVATLFFQHRLRGALLSFDPQKGEGAEAAWLTTVLYRYALKFAFTDAHLQRTMDTIMDMADPAIEPEAVIESQAREQALKQLPLELKKLPDRPRLAVQLYFGLEGPPQKISDIARKLGTSSYFARSAVMSGLATLAVQLPAVGTFSSQEQDLARKVFVEGCLPKEAGSSLGMSSEQIRATSGHLMQKLRAGLRVRTSKGTKSETKEFEMSEPRDAGIDTIVQYLKERGGAHVDFIPDKRGTEIAVIGNYRIPVVTLYRASRKDPALEDRLRATMSADQLAHLITPDISEFRTDLPEDHDQWREALERSSSDSLANAETLFQLFLDRAAEIGFSVPADMLEGAIMNIRNSLGDVLQSLEQEMSWEMRTSGGARLQVRFMERGKRLEARWLDEQSGPKETIDLADLTRHGFELIGGFSQKTLDLLVETFGAALIEDVVGIPGLVFEARSGGAQEGSIVLRWQPPVMESP
jgi:DNA-directed RNA polymerase specialized sigma24 family protein